MKKLTKILAALVLAAASLVMSGCQEGDEVYEVLAGPVNTWCKMPLQYKHTDSSESASLHAWFYYTETQKTIAGKTFPAGLSIVIVSDPKTGENGVSAIINGLKSNAYILKHFPKDADATIDDGDTTYSFKGTREKWSAIYWANEELRNNKTSKYPSQLDGTFSLNWDDIKNQFSWKKILANYLLSVLEG